MNIQPSKPRSILGTLFSPMGLLWLILILATVLRFYQLDAHPLWIDEVFTGIIADPENSFSEVLWWVYNEPYTMAPLIFFVEHVLMNVFGESVIVLRLFGAITGTLAVFVIYKLGELWFNKRVGLISAVLLAVSPLHIFHSREARYYAPIILFSLLSYYFLFRAVKTNDRKMWLGFVLVTLANLYTHLSTLILVGVEGAYIVLVSLMDKNIFKEAGFSFRDIRKSYFGGFVVSLAVSCLLFLPSVPSIIRWISNSDVFGNQIETIGLDFGPSFILGIFASFGAGDGVALSLFFGLFLMGLLVSFQKKRQVFFIFTLAFTLPFVVIGFLRPEHWFSAKYVIFLLPLSLIAVSLGVEYLADQFVRFVSRWYTNNVIFPVALTLFTLPFVYFGLSTLDTVYSTKLDNWQDYSVFLSNNVESNDVIAALPQNFGLVQTDLVLEYLLPSEYTSSVVLVNDASDLVDLANSNHRVWFVRHEIPTSANLTSIDFWFSEQQALPFVFAEGDVIYYFGSAIGMGTLLEEADQFEITEPNLFVSLGDAYTAEARWDESIVAYQNAVALAPDVGIYHFRLAAAFHQLEEVDAAEQAYLEAIEVDPLIPGFHAGLAGLYLEIERPQEAKAHYQEAIQLWKSGRYDDQGGYLETWQQAVDQIEILLVD